VAKVNVQIRVANGSYELQADVRNHGGVTSSI
jgi:hypothetical protein